MQQRGGSDSAFCAYIPGNILSDKEVNEDKSKHQTFSCYKKIATNVYSIFKEAGTQSLWLEFGTEKCCR